MGEPKSCPKMWVAAKRKIKDILESDIFKKENYFLRLKKDVQIKMISLMTALSSDKMLSIHQTDSNSTQQQNVLSCQLIYICDLNM